MRGPSLLICCALCFRGDGSHAAVTFLVSPDTHFTQSGGVADVGKNSRGIADMNLLPSVPYPTSSIFGGAVEESIRGVVVPGDLVDDGCSMVPSSKGDPGCATQWANYTSLFKVSPPRPADSGGAPAAAACRWPAFEGVGNHDGGNSSDPKTGLVRRGVIARNRERAATPGTAGAHNYSMSPNNLHYSWDWDGVHFVMLGVYPGTVGDCASGRGNPGGGCCGDPSRPICWGWHSPEHSLDFLISDLAQLDKAIPTVLFMHYGIRGFGAPGTVPWSGYSPDFWWSSREALAFGQAIAAHNIVGIVHGHTHACVFYQWDLTNETGRVYDVYNAPALQKGGPNDPLATPSQYLTFEIDVDAGHFRAFQRVGNAWGKISHEKNISRIAPATTLPFADTSGGTDGGMRRLGAYDSAMVGVVKVLAEDTKHVLPWHTLV